MVLTAYAVLSPETNSSCHRHRRIGLIETRLGRLRLRRLDTSNGCQDHTVCPSATSAVRLRAAIAHRHSIESPPCDSLTRPTLPRPPHPMPRVSDDHDTPPSGWDGGGYGGDLGKTGSGMFLRKGVDGTNQVELIGQIEVRTQAER
jgi:hypothetical protein